MQAKAKFKGVIRNKCFRRTQTALNYCPVLGHYDPEAETELHTDVLALMV
jgi:hypothetical protein